MFTGVATHAVFSEGLFVRYGYQLQLIPVGATEGSAARPYSRNGLLAWSVRDRVWEHWWKRTQSPWTPLAQASSLLGRWADFYWHPAAGSVTVRIDARPQHVELAGIDTALFSRNNAVAWKAVGTIQLNERGIPTTAWINAPATNNETLSTYFSRVLTADQ
jgi:hypothetical protein